MTTKPEPICILDDARGIYIPQGFAQMWRAGTSPQYVTGVSDDKWAILEAGPGHEHYWETWDDVGKDAVVTDSKGIKYRLYQDGDCWLIPEGMKWSDKADWFIWPDEDYEAVP
jgi:hypothetical protein